MDQVKQHFDAEANEFDEIIVRLIPYYTELIQTLVDGIAFDRESKISVLDLGCGTGTLARRIADLFPQARFTMLDIAPNMIEKARQKMSNRPDTEYVVSDFTHYDFPPERFDLVVSSLALHHAETDADKIDLYRRIYQTTRHNGQFLCFDITLGPTDHLIRFYMDKWIEFMRKSCSEDDIQNIWLKSHREEDRPAPLAKHLKWLEEVGFEGVDVLVKYCLGAVFSGIKK